MRLTAVCICGTLLALSSLFWTTADSDEGDLLGDHGFGPCAATLRPEGPCRQGQDACPYLFSLPPLTLHLPKQLRELEEIVKDLQKLKDNVDQLRKMCADCTVSQTERTCGRQTDREHEKLNEGTDRHGDERKWLNERASERPKECGTDRVKAEKTVEGGGDTDSEKSKVLEEKEKKKWEKERESDKGVVKENEREETLKEVAEKDGKTKTGGTKGKDKVGQAKVPTASGNEEIVDRVGKKVTEKNNRETAADRNKDKDGKGNSKGDPEDKSENGKERKITSNVKNKEKTEKSDHHVWREETEETEKKTQTEEDRGSDGIKMSEDHDEHTNKEREQHGEEKIKEMEKGIQVERNNEKPKQTESIGRAEKEETIKEGEVEDTETGTGIKKEGHKTVQSVQRDSDGELSSSKATERTDFVSISPTPDSIISLAPRHDSKDSNEVITFTSSLPSPLSSSASHLITDVNQGVKIVADGLPTQSSGLTDNSEHPNPDAEEDFRTIGRPTTATINTLGGPGQQITRPTSGFTSTTSARPGAGVEGRASSSMATTTTSTPRQNLYTNTFPEVADRSHWTAKKNISSNTKTGLKPPPGRGPKPGEKHKPAIKPEADQKLKNPKNDRKPDQVFLTDKKTKHEPKQKPSHPKPKTEQKTKPGKDTKKVQIIKPAQKPLPDYLPTDQDPNNNQNPKKNQIPKHDQEHTTDGSQLPTRERESPRGSALPGQKPTSHQRPQTVNTTVSDRDTQTGQEPESAKIPIPPENSKPEKKPVHPLKTDEPDQTHKTHIQEESEEKTDEKSRTNQYFTPVKETQPEGTSLTPKANQKPITELHRNSDENPLLEPKSAEWTPGQKLTPGRAVSKLSDQNPKPSQKTPKVNQKPISNQKQTELITGQKTKPKVKPKTNQTPQTNPGLRTSQPGLRPKSVRDEIPGVGSNKTSKLRPPPRRRPPARPTVRPGATPVQRPKPAVPLKPSPKTKTELDPPQISGTTSNNIQNSQTHKPPASGPVTQNADVSLPLGDTEFSPSTMKTITMGPKTSNSLEAGPFPRLHTLAEGSTMSPNSRITSDLRPQTASGQPLIPTTTRPNTIIHGILPSVIPSTGPGSTRPNQASNPDPGLQAKILDNGGETAPRKTPDSDKAMIPAPIPSAENISTVSPDLRSTTLATSGPEPLAAESSTPTARELRVKINQVAAFFNNSLSPNGGPPERRPKEHPEDSQGGSRPDSKLPTLIPSKGNMSRDCSDLLLRGETKSRVYLVTPDLRSRSFPVLCDMQLGGGGWTLLQRRQDGSVSFNRTWAEYRSGFGELDGGEFWLGNNMIHLLTRDRDMMLRVELVDFNGVMEYAEYKHFRVASERLRYRLSVGGYSGTAGDALRYSKSYDHNNRAFTTPDRDHDRYPSGNCGAYYSSGWWFDACMAANLNGRYYMGKYKGVRDGIFWGTWHNISTEYYPTNDRQSFKYVRMMIRPKGFAP